MTPTLENPSYFDLPPNGDIILQQMFKRYKRIVVKDEFSGGFSGSRVFLIRPINQDDTPALPAVVKMASVSLIEKEWLAYKNCIHDRLPDVAEVKGEPVLPPHSDWGGLRYALVGDGTSEIEALHEYAYRAAPEDIRFVVENQLLTNLKQIWRFGRQTYSEFPLRVRYDRVLPVNLLVKPTPVPSEIEPILVKPLNFPNPAMIKAGDYVRLEGFIVTKVDLVHQTITLNLPTVTNDLPQSYTARLKSVDKLAVYSLNQLIDSVEGIVLETRQEKLELETKRVLGPQISLSTPKLSLPDGSALPNPLQVLPHILNDSHHVWASYIHGDLNLGNILVAPATREVGLIDFAEARQDYVLHDLLRLETEVITHIVARIISHHKLPVAHTMRCFYEQLYWTSRQDIETAQTLKRIAGQLPHPDLIRPFAILVPLRHTMRRFLFNFDDQTEYYQGLTIYLMGAMKFRNLNGPTKQVAFWGAATLQQLLLKPPPPPVSPPPPSETHGQTRPIERLALLSLWIMSLLLLIALVVSWQQRSTPIPAQVQLPTPTTAKPLLNSEAAISLSRPTDTPTPTATPTLTPTSTPTLTSTATTSQTLPPSPTMTPTPQPAISAPTTTPTLSPTPTSAVANYQAPILISPAAGSNLTQNTAFVWEWPGQLAPNHSFEVRLWLGDNPHYGAYDARETLTDMQSLGNNRYSLSFNLADAYSVIRHGNSADYFWSVALVELEPYRDLGFEAEARPVQINLFGRGGSSGSGGDSGSGGVRPAPPPPN